MVIPSIVRTSTVAVIDSGCMNGVMPPAIMVPRLTVGRVPSNGWTASANNRLSASAVSAWPMRRRHAPRWALMQPNDRAGHGRPAAARTNRAGPCTDAPRRSHLPCRLVPLSPLRHCATRLGPSTTWRRNRSSSPRQPQARDARHPPAGVPGKPGDGQKSHGNTSFISAAPSPKRRSSMRSRTPYGSVRREPGGPPAAWCRGVHHHRRKGASPILTKRLGRSAARESSSGAGRPTRPEGHGRLRQPHVRLRVGWANERQRPRSIAPSGSKASSIARHRRFRRRRPMRSFEITDEQSYATRPGLRLLYIACQYRRRSRPSAGRPSPLIAFEQLERLMRRVARSRRGDKGYRNSGQTRGKSYSDPGSISAVGPSWPCHHDSQYTYGSGPGQSGRRAAPVPSVGPFARAGSRIGCWQHAAAGLRCHD